MPPFSRSSILPFFLYRRWMGGFFFFRLDRDVSLLKGYRSFSPFPPGFDKRKGNLTFLLFLRPRGVGRQRPPSPLCSTERAFLPRFWQAIPRCRAIPLFPLCRESRAAYTEYPPSSHERKIPGPSKRLPPSHPRRRTSPFFFINKTAGPFPRSKAIAQSRFFSLPPRGIFPFGQYSSHPRPPPPPPFPFTEKRIFLDQ